MTPRRIVLIRHDKPQIVEGVPSADWRLSDAGRAAAADLAQDFRHFEFARIAGSPEPKAVGTAEAFAKTLGLTVEIDPGLAEHARRSMGFLSREELETGVARFFAEPDRLVFGNESADAAYERFAGAIARQPGRDVIAVTHGTILSIYVSRAAAIDPFAFWRALTTPAAVVLEAGKAPVVHAR